MTRRTYSKRRCMNAKHALGLIFFSLLALHQPALVKAERSISDIEAGTPTPSSSPIKQDEKRSCKDIESPFEYQICMGLSKAEIIGNLVISKISSAISISGSIYVIQDVLRNPEKRNESTYHRLMFGLSCSDVMYSFFAWFLGSWVMPKGLHLFAIGSEGSCAAVGFFHVIFNISYPFYYCSLSTFYLMQLKLSWGKRKIQAIEKWLHILPWTAGLIVAISALSLSTLGPYLNVCWLKRGSPYVRPFEIFALFAYFSCMGYVTIVMFLVYWNARKVETEAQQYSFPGYSSSRRKTMGMSRRIMFQAVLYSFVLLYPGVIFAFSVAKVYNYAILLLGVMFFPLQGFFNALIYAIPVFRQMMKTRQQKQKQSQQKHINKKPKQDRQSVSKTTWLIRCKTSFKRILMGSQRNGTECNKIPTHEQKTGSNNQLGLRSKHNQGEVSNQKKVSFSTTRIPTKDHRGVKSQQDEHTLCLNSQSNVIDIEEQKEEETKSENSNIMSMTNLIQHVDEEQSLESFEIPQCSELKEKEESQDNNFSALDEDIDVFESANNEDSDSDSEIYVDDYLRLMRIQQ